MTHPLQQLVDAMSAGWQGERAATQMTLGKLIEALGTMPADAALPCLGHPHSYRGYYSDLAFEQRPGQMTAGELLALAKECDGKTYCGWKGGDYTMGDDTPLWIAEEGCCGLKLIGIEDGKYVTATDEF